MSSFDLAFVHAPHGVACVGLDGCILRANPALCDLLGATDAQLQGIDLQTILHEAEREAERASRAALLAGEAVVHRQEFRLLHQRGSTVWGSLTRVLARAPDGVALHFIDQWQDRTEQRRADKEIVLLNNLTEQRIQRRTRELEDSNQDLREFAYSIAHDLRGPLASIDGFSARLQRGLADQVDENQAHYLRRVRAGVRTLSELTDGLLALAAISRAELAHTEVDLSALAASVLARLRAQEPQREAEIVVAPAPPVTGDAQLLANVIENLLSNAWKFSAHRAPARIAFGSEVTPEGLLFYVRDNGAGFDAAHAGKLFTPFQRLHPATEFEGNGIGLALVRKILARHGGQVWAESAPGEGACFRFTVGS